MNLHVLAVCIIKMIEQVFEKKILNAKKQQILFVFINFIILIDLRSNFISKKNINHGTSSTTKNGRRRW